MKNIFVWYYFELEPVVQEMLIFSIFSSDGNFVQWSGTIWAIWLRALWGTSV